MIPESYRPQLIDVMQTGLDIVQNPVMDTQQFLKLYKQSKDIFVQLIPEQLRQPLYSLAQTSMNVLENPADANQISKVMQESQDVVSRMTQLFSSGNFGQFMNMFNQPSASTYGRFNPAGVGYTQV